LFVNKSLPNKRIENVLILYNFCPFLRKINVIFLAMRYNGKIKAIGVRSGALLIVSGLALNIALNTVTGSFSLPLYLDCVGTILCAMLGGVFPAVIVGAFTNIAKGLLSNTFSIYYGVISILFALITVYFYNRRFFSSIPKFFLAVLCYAVLGGGLSSVFDYYINHQTFGTGVSAPLAHSIHAATDFSVFCSQMSAGIIVDLYDKALVLTIAIVIFHFIPKRIKSHLRHVFLCDERKRNEGMVLKRSLLRKVVMVVVFSEVLLAVFVMNIGYFLYHEQAINKYTTMAQGLVDAAAIAVDPNRIPDFVAQGREAEGFEETEKKLYAIREGFPTAKFLYVYRIGKDSTQVVFDLDYKGDGEEEDVEGVSPGQVIPHDNGISASLPALLKGEPVGPVVTVDSLGWLLTVFKPLEDSSGNLAAYVATDFSMRSIRIEQIAFIIKFLSLFFGVSLVIMVIIMEVIKRRVVVPVDRMSHSAISFAYNSEAGRKIGLRRIHALDIDSKDEIQNLYNAFATMAEDFLQYIVQLQKQNARITRMQDEIIINFAELVEARDEGTGNHIKKTAAYVEAIARQLKAEGIYTDILTEDYITRLKRSAPLHDIGKIAISDLILNKPGKLTDEEFEIMKGHTTEGWKILQKIVSNTGDSMEAGYLKEAIEMAHFHHEKWDGSGYPTKISGDQIPLSARIMAVADVFDALVAERVYKKPFTFEKAMTIITEGAGKHFDPKVVEAFSHIAEGLYGERTRLEVTPEA